ncbi:MAG: hypothetical protein U1F43_11785 [Myxococcota bacterium]
MEKRLGTWFIAWLSGLVGIAGVARADSEPPVQLAAATPPVGFDTPGFELHDISAWTLRSGELEWSPEALRLGLGGFFQIGSYYALDAIGALNAQLAATFFSGPKVAIGARAGFVYFDPAFVGIDTDFDLLAFPIAVEISGRPLEHVRVHGAFEFLSARPKTQAPDAALRIERHIGPVGRLAVKLGGEYRFGAHYSVLSQLELPLAAQRANLRYVGEGDGIGDGLRFEVALHMVFEAFNLRIGGGYGPSFLGKSGFFPIFAIGVRVY